MQIATLRYEIGRVRFPKQTFQDCLGNAPSESHNHINGEEKNLPFLPSTFLPSIMLTVGGDFMSTARRSGFYHTGGYFALRNRKSSPWKCAFRSELLKRGSRDQTGWKYLSVMPGRFVTSFDGRLATWKVC